MVLKILRHGESDLVNLEEINKKLDAIEIVLKREARFYAEEIVSKEKILESTRANEAHMGNALSELQNIRRLLVKKERENDGDDGGRTDSKKESK